MAVPILIPDTIRNPDYLNNWEPVTNRPTGSIYDYISRAINNQPYPYGKTADQLIIDETFLNSILDKDLIVVKAKIVNSLFRPYAENISPIVLSLPIMSHLGFWNEKDAYVTLFDKGTLVVHALPKHTPDDTSIWGPLVAVAVWLGFDKWLQAVGSADPIVSLINIVAKINDRLRGFIDEVNKTWVPKIHAAGKAVSDLTDDIAKTVKAPLKVLTDEVNETIGPGLDAVKETQKAFQETFDAIDKTQEEVTGIVKDVQIAYEEAILAPLGKTKQNIDRHMKEVADFLSVVGVKEGREARKTIDSKLDGILEETKYPVAGMSSFRLRFERTFNTFKDTLFKDVKKSANRSEAIIDSAIELLETENVETSVLKARSLSDTIGNAPNTTIINLDNAGQKVGIHEVGIPAPVENNLPEIKQWSDMLDISDAKMYLDEQGVALVSKQNPDGTVVIRGEDYLGVAVAAEQAIREAIQGVADDIVAAQLFWSQAIDDGTVFEILQPLTDPKIMVTVVENLARERFAEANWLGQWFWETAAVTVIFWFDEPRDDFTTWAQFTDDFWKVYNSWYLAYTIARDKFNNAREEQRKQFKDLEERGIKLPGLEP